MASTKRKQGTVYLVGAGPGHPELITRLGYRLLRECDAVVYDDLVPMELLSDLGESTELHYVGKRGGRRSRNQDEINRLLLRLAGKGKRVVRLKGGDPMVFGRGGEEASVIAAAGHYVVVVPGVTAVTAAAAGSGVPLTDRRAASWLFLATGHEADSPSPPVPWDELHHLGGGTIAVYMGVRTLDRIVERLIAGGFPPETPAAAISNAYSGLQRVVHSELGQLPERARGERLQSPALLIIGGAAALGGGATGLQAGPLAGLRVLVTRPARPGGDLCSLLREAGAEPLPLPTIRTEPCDDPEGWERFGELAYQPGWCVFTSRTGVREFRRDLLERGYDLRALSRMKFAVVGAGTAAELGAAGFRSDLVPGEATVAALAGELAGESLAGVNVLRVRGTLSDDTLESRVRAEDGVVSTLTVYRTLTARWEPHLTTMVTSNPPDWVTFTSGSTLNGLLDNLGEEEVKKLFTTARAVSIGPVTSAHLKEAGIPVHLEAKEHTIPGLVQALVAQTTA